MSTVSTAIHNPNSFHPIFRATFNLERNEEAGRCSLHLLYRLIPSVFIDPYELAQRQVSYTFIKWGGSTELEKPVHAVQDSITNVLLTINLPLYDEGAEILRFDVDVPLHARYLAPLSNDMPFLDLGSYRHLPLERPQAFFACPRDFSRESSSTPPAHITASQLTEAKLMFNTTDFIHVPHSPNNPADFVRVPVGRKEDLAGVQVATAAVVLFAFLWAGAVIILTCGRLFGSHDSRRPKVD